MAEYSFLNLEMIAEAQADKEITANAILEALAKGAGVTSVSVASGNVTLTETQSHYGVILLTGAPGAARVVTVDADISRAILFRNDTTGGQVIEVEQTGGTNFPVPAGKCVLLLSTTEAIGLPPDPLTLGGTASLAQLTVYIPAAATKGVVVRNAASQTANAIEVQDSGGNPLMYFGGNGSTTQFLNMTNGSYGFFYNGQISSLYRFGVTSDGATSILFGLRAHASQSADVYRLLNSSNVVQLAIAANCRDFILDATTGTKWGTATTQKQGWWNATPVVQSTGWSVTNGSTDKALDVTGDTLAQVAATLGTLIDQLKSYGLLGA